MQPVDPCWKDVEEVVIQPQLPQTLLIADLIRQRCQPVVPQIDLEEISVVFEDRGRYYFQIGQSQTEASRVIEIVVSTCR